MSDNPHNINATGNGEISSNCCSNCMIEVNKIEGNTNNKSNKFKWFDRKKCDERNVGIVEAIAVVFEGLLHMNGKQISPNESLSMCLTCADNISELYRIYREFMERSVAGSYFRELFPLCMLWPSKTTKIEKSIVSANHKSKELRQSELYSAESLKETEYEVKVEIFDDEIENDKNYCDLALPSDNEHYSENEPLTVTTNIKSKKKKKNISVKELPQFLNGTWVLPKLVKILLKKYVPGDSNTLEIGKSMKIIGTTIRVNQESDLTVTKACSICNQVFANGKMYFEHRRKHKEKKERFVKKYPCNYCGKFLKGKYQALVHETAVHSKERPFECETCGKTFALKVGLKLHEQSHLGIGNHKCTQCDKQYITSCRLREHMAGAHGVVNLSVCDECGKTYATPTRLQKHKRCMHSKQDTKHTCEQCGKVLKNRRLYNDHLKMHSQSDERPFLCTVCGNCFKHRKSLHKHTVAQHGQNAAATCQQCERGFMKIADYEEHMVKGYHLKPKWLRPKATRKRNLNAPSYLKARIERKLERQIKRLEKDPSAPTEIQSALIKDAEEKLQLLKVKKRHKKSAQKAEMDYSDEPMININDNNDEYESVEYESEEYE